jgi:hypothetical protein
VGRIGRRMKWEKGKGRREKIEARTTSCQSQREEQENKEGETNEKGVEINQSIIVQEWAVMMLRYLDRRFEVILLTSIIMVEEKEEGKMRKVWICVCLPYVRKLATS